MDVNIFMSASSRFYLPQTRIPAVAIHWSGRALREHGTIEEAMSCSTRHPMQEVTKDVGRRQVYGHPLCIVDPYLFAMVPCSINCQVAPIRRELHAQYTIRLSQAKVIAKTDNRLWVTQRLPAASPGSTSQHKTCRLFEGVVDIQRSVRGVACPPDRVSYFCISSIRRNPVCTVIIGVSLMLPLDIEYCH